MYQYVSTWIVEYRWMCFKIHTVMCNYNISYTQRIPASWKDTQLCNIVRAKPSIITIYNYQWKTRLLNTLQKSLRLVKLLCTEPQIIILNSICLHLKIKHWVFFLYYIEKHKHIGISSKACIFWEICSNLWIN